MPYVNTIQQRIDVGGVTLAVTRVGEGPALILLHGIGSSGQSWLPVQDELARAFQLVIPDLRGHGASDKPASGYLIEDYVRDLGGLLDALALERFAIVGHSLGALIALAWATRNPSRAQALVLEDPPLRPGNPGTFDHWIALASSPVEEVAARYHADFPHWSAEDCLRRARIITSTAIPVFSELRDAVATSGPADWIGQFQAIETPILFLHGDLAAGGVVAQEDADRFAAAVPHATVRRIAGGSHSLHREHTARFLAETLAFLHAHGVD